MITFPQIQQIICTDEILRTELLQMKTRKHEIVFARQAIMYFLRKYTKESWDKIGGHYSQNHATAMHAYKTISNYIDTDKKIEAKILFWDFKIASINEFGENLVFDKICELIELIRMQIDNLLPISHQTIIIYNDLVNKTQFDANKIIDKIVKGDIIQNDSK